MMNNRLPFQPLRAYLMYCTWLFVPAYPAHRFHSIIFGRISNARRQCQRPETVTITKCLRFFLLTRKIALITSGTRGVGQPMALALVEAGADIILVQAIDDRWMATKSRTERDVMIQEPMAAVEYWRRSATIILTGISSLETLSIIAPEGSER